MAHVRYTIPLESLGMQDLPQVGGKNASLGEMLVHLGAAGVLVPHGFATTAEAYQEFLAQNNLNALVHEMLHDLDVNDIERLSYTGKTLREAVINADFSIDFIEAVKTAFDALVQKIGHARFTVAVRSSATAEDLPDASFAGQQETFLNVSGVEDILYTIKHVFASLYNDRAIAYRAHHGFDAGKIAISAGVQQMIRSDLAASGVMFTLDTESGFNEVVLITSSYGLGEMIVQGAVNPDEFYVHKPNLRANRPAVIRKMLGSKALKMVYDEQANGQRIKTLETSQQEQNVFSLSHEDIEGLAKQALIIESHYGRPMDIEWAKDGEDGKLYILQARPETVKSRQVSAVQERYTLKTRSTILAKGRSIGQRIGQGQAKIIQHVEDMHQVKPGDVLITDMTDPDWEPIMKRASAIVTNRGGRTCHAAIIARELGIPAVVGCQDATSTIKDGTSVTVSCAEGDDGYVYEGLLPFDKLTLDVDTMPILPLKVMLNVGNPERAFTFQAVPNAGVGLARLEFLISNMIGIHPKAILNLDTLNDLSVKKTILDKTAAYASPVEYYVERLKEGIVTIAAAFYPKPVIVRFSDFKSNEYANLCGGAAFEPHEENPMLGFRGASRYVSDDFAACFALECQAIRRAREDMGFKNIEVMIPFVRTVAEAAAVVDVLKTHGLERGREDLRLIMMCEIPSNAILADQFLPYFDGFSIGSNDITQLTLGLDRDSSLVASQFDERNDAVKYLLHLAIQSCKRAGKYIGICGQGPSDHPDFAEWLMQEGIDSVSLNPDSVLETCLFLAKKHS